jgi:hypothetical protein
MLPTAGGRSERSPAPRRSAVPLLHTRLRFLVLVFAVFYTVVVFVRIVHPGKLVSEIDDWANPTTVVNFLGLG